MLVGHWLLHKTQFATFEFQVLRKNNHLLETLVFHILVAKIP